MTSDPVTLHTELFQKFNDQTSLAATDLAPAKVSWCDQPQALEPAFAGADIIDSRPQGEIDSPIAVTPSSAPFGQNVRSKAFFEYVISAEWRKNVASIIGTGKLLNQAKEELDSDIFAALKVPFEPRVSQMLRRIAANLILSSEANFSSLPPCWRTLYELTKLSDAFLRSALADGRIHPGLKQKEVRLLRDLAPAETKSSKKKKNGQTGTQLDPIAMWKAFSTADKRAILSSEGRSGLAKLLSPELMVDLVDHLIRQEMVWASTKLKPAVILTSILRATLDPALDSNVVFGRLRAKLASFGLDLHDVSIALSRRRKR